MNTERSKIVMVDDNIANLTLGRNILREFYEVYPAPSAGKLFEILENVLPDLILLDVDMPEVNGYDVIKIIKADRRFVDIPVIFLTAKNDADSELEGFNLGAVDYVTKPFSGPLLLKRIKRELAFARQTRELLESHCKIKEYANNLKAKVDTKVEEVMGLQNTILATVADLVEFRDRDTGGHVARTKSYLRILFNELLRENLYADVISTWNVHDFLASSQLHDVGKIAISDSILCKPGPLTPDEFETMKQHVMFGVRAIERIVEHTRDSDFLLHALAVVAAHHEKWDGTGYPIGFGGDMIPLEGRLMAIVDVYDALVSVRPYKKALPHGDACKIIGNGAGTHFDPVLVDVFLKVENELNDVREASLEKIRRPRGLLDAS